MRIGILTGGGDCPGLNAVIRAAVLTARLLHGDDVVGFIDGWKGVLEGELTPLEVERCRDLLPVGGTVLGTSRTNPFANDGGADRVVGNLKELGVDALVVIGGEDTLGVAIGSIRTECRSSAYPRRSTTTSRARRSPSGSTRQSRSPPRPSIVCGRRPSLIIGSWSAR